MGFRFRLHRRDLPGSPDLVFPGRRAVIFVNGCFWHGHQCSKFRWPRTRKVFWEKKIKDSMRRDITNIQLLQCDGWRVLVVWECSLSDSRGLGVKRVLNNCKAFILSEDNFSEIGEGLNDKLWK